MPRSPRSELELTGKSSTTATTTPLTTRLTCPEAFSVMKKSFGPKKAMQVGWFRPETAVVTLRVGSTSVGFTANAFPPL